MAVFESEGKEEDWREGGVVFFFRRLAVIFSGGRFFLEGGRKLERKGE